MAASVISCGAIEGETAIATIDRRESAESGRKKGLSGDRHATSVKRSRYRYPSLAGVLKQVSAETTAGLSSVIG